MRNRLVLAVAGCFLLLPWIFFDIDLGDQSYHSLGSWLMAFHPKMPPGELPYWFEQVPIWFSYFVDSIWWRIIGPSASLLAVRFGWLLFQLMVLQGLYSVFARFYPGRKTVLALLIGLLAVNCAADQFVLSYYVVPPAFGALGFAFLARALLDRSRGWACAAGAFLAFAMQARIPSALPIAAAMAVIFAYSVVRERRVDLSVWGFVVLGVAGGTGAALAAAVWSGQWEYYIPGVRSFFHGVSAATNQRYSKGMVLLRLVGHYERISVGAILFFVAYLGLAFCPARWRRLAWVPALVAIVLFALAKYGTLLGMVIGGACVVVARGFLSRRDFSPARVALLLGALACVATFTLGTYLEGIQNFKYGLWILVPLALLEREGTLEAAWLVTCAVVLFAVTRVMWPTYPYLEQPLFRMTTSLGMPETAGILSYPEKARELRELHDKLQELGVREGDPLLAYASVEPLYPISGVYLLTRTVPLLEDPGIVEYPGSRWSRHRAVIEALLRKGVFPSIVVRERQTFPRVPPSPGPMLKALWIREQAVMSAVSLPGQSTGLAGELDSLLLGNGYQILWENGNFQVLGVTRGGSGSL